MAIHENEPCYLDSMLKKINPQMSLEKVDGLFAGLICSPGTGSFISDWGHVVGSHHLTARSAFDNEQTFENCVSKLKLHWQKIFDRISANQFHTLWLDENSICPGNNWAQGFMQAVEYDRESWMRLIDDERFCGVMLPIAALANEFDLDPDMRLYEGGIDAEMRDKLILLIESKLPFIYRYFHDEHFEKMPSWKSDTLSLPFFEWLHFYVRA